MKHRQSSVIAQLGIELHYDTKPTNNIQETKQFTKPKTGLFKMVEISQEPPATAPTTAPAPTDDRLVVFTDGACSNNGSARARAGYGVVWPHNRALDVSKRLPGHEQTNNRAEFMALIEAQAIADSIDPTGQKPLYVYTDSELLINSITKWLAGWKSRQWRKSDNKPVLNRDLLQRIDENPRPLVFKHVRAHTGRRDWESLYNEEADRLARGAING